MFKAMPVEAERLLQEAPDPIPSNRPPQLAADTQSQAGARLSIFPLQEPDNEVPADNLPSFGNDALEVLGILDTSALAKSIAS